MHKILLRPVVTHSLVLSGSGRRGNSETFSKQPAMLFRGDRIIVRDSLDGLGTRVHHFMVGSRIQLQSWYAATYPGGLRALPRNGSLAPMRTIDIRRALGREGALPEPFDTCEPMLFMHVTVDFIEDCEFSVEIIGKGVPV